MITNHLRTWTRVGSLVGLTSALALGCSSDEPDSGGTGGAASTGGETSTGGAASTGGATSTGGTATGGDTGTGGMGGDTSTGGVATGGETSTGGAATGGETSTGGTATGGETSTGGAATGGETSTGGMGGDTSTGGETSVVINNPYAADWALLAQQASKPEDLNQCMGFVSGSSGTYRSYGVQNPNPKDGNPCLGAGNTAQLDGSCNVPGGGFMRGDSAIGNKACTCDTILGFDCTTSPLPGVVFEAPSVCGDTVANMHEEPCTAEFNTCMTEDLPTNCEYTTPKGCVCLQDSSETLRWQCGTTNSWFDCNEDLGIPCPSTWPSNLISGADIKVHCNDPSCNSSPACRN